MSGRVPFQGHASGDAGKDRETSEGDVMDAPDKRLVAAKVELDAAKSELDAAKSELTAAKSDLGAAILSLSAARAGGDDNTIAVALSQYNRADGMVELAQSSVVAAQELKSACTKVVAGLMSHGMTLNATTGSVSFDLLDRVHQLLA